MKHLETLLTVTLGLFDGGAGAAAGAAATASGGAEGTGSAQGDTQKASSGNTRRSKTGEYANVVFGRQESSDKGADSTANAENSKGETMQQNAAGSAKTGAEDLRREFLDLVNSKYKDVYTAETQRIINDRFKKEKGKEQQLTAQQPIIDALMRHYGIEDGDLSKLRASFEGDEAMNGVLFAKEAEASGMSVEQYRKYLQVQQENKELRQQEESRQARQKADETYNDWIRQATELAGKYPQFDLKTEVANNPRFVSMLRAGIPVQHAYEVTHLEDILAGNAASAAREMEKRVMDNVRAKGMRPSENGTSSQPGVVVKSDPNKFTKADRAEIARRVRRGERIVL